MSGAEPVEKPGAPRLRVVRGTPEPAELAALVAVVAARTAAARGTAATEPEREVSRWSDPATMLGGRPAPSPHAWRTSGWGGPWAR